MYTMFAGEMTESRKESKKERPCMLKCFHCGREYDLFVRKKKLGVSLNRALLVCSKKCEDEHFRPIWRKGN